MGQDMGFSDQQDSGSGQSDGQGPPPVPGGPPPVPSHESLPVTPPPSAESTRTESWHPVTLEQPLYRPRLFFRTDMPMWLYVPMMGLFSLIPALAISAILTWANILTGENGPKFEGPPVVVFIGVAVFSPVVETLIMAGILWVCSFVTGNRTKLAIISAVIWGAFHSLFSLPWGLVVAWPFFVFSSAYLAWRGKSIRHGLLVAMAIHAFHNFGPAVLFLIDTL